MAQSSVLSIDVCRGLGISPLRSNIWLSFSQADLGPRSDFFFGNIAFPLSPILFARVDFSVPRDGHFAPSRGESPITLHNTRTQQQYLYTSRR